MKYELHHAVFLKLLISARDCPHTVARLEVQRIFTP